MALVIQKRNPQTGVLTPIANTAGFNESTGGFEVPKVAGFNDKGGTVLQGGGYPNLPPRKSVEESYQELIKSGLLPKFQPLQGFDPNKFDQLKGFDDAYYQNLTQNAERRLNEQYFDNDNSLQAKLKNQMNKRGLIGSGIEAGGTTDLFKSFGGELGAIQSDVMTKRAENDFQVATKNRDFMYNADLANKEIEKFNQDLQARLTQLGLEAAGTESTQATDYATKTYQSEVDRYNKERDQANERLQNLSDQMKNELVDPETRQYYEDLYNAIFGKSPQEAEKITNQFYTNRTNADETKRRAEQVKKEETEAKQPKDAHGLPIGADIPAGQERMGSDGKWYRSFKGGRGGTTVYWQPVK